MSHYLHYVVRRIATPDYKNPSDPYFVDHQPDDQGLFRPAFHDVPGGHGFFWGGISTRSSCFLNH